MDGFFAWLLALLGSLSRPEQQPPVVNVTADGGSDIPTILGVHPAWAAVIVAIVVGTFTVRGIRASFHGLALQRRTYADNAWQSKIAAARMVYCDIGIRRTLKAGDGRDAFGIKGATPLGQNRFTPTNENGTGPLIAKEELAGFYFVAKNTSHEPMGNVILRFIPPGQDDESYVGGAIFGDTLGPGDERSWTIWMHRSWPEDQNERVQLKMFFTDSAGVQWERIQLDPPQEPHVYGDVTIPRPWWERFVSHRVRIAIVQWQEARMIKREQDEMI